MIDWYDKIIEEMKALEPNLFGSYLVTIRLIEKPRMLCRFTTDFVYIHNTGATWEHDWNEGQEAKLEGFIELGNLEIHGYDPTLKRIIVQ